MPEAVAAYVAEFFAFDLAAGATLTSIASTAAYVATTVAINQAASALLASSTGSGGTAGTQVLSTTVRQSDAARRLIYGRCKVGGVLAYPHQSPGGKYVRQAIYLGEGPIAGVDPVFWIGDELSSASQFAGLTVLEPFLGTAGQGGSADLVAVSSSEWTVDDKGAGCAWVKVRLESSRKAFPRGRINTPLAFMASGRVCFDPRTSTTAHTRNPALILLDFIRCEFGPDGGIDDELIDFDSFAAAANVCDELVDSVDPANVADGTSGKVRRYTLDGVFEVSAGHTAIKETIERAMAGRLVFVGGQYRCYAGAWRAPSGPALTADYLREAPTFRTHQTRTQRYNTARGTYREPLQAWETTDFPEQQLAAAVVAEDGEIVQSIDLPVTTNGATAQRLARLAMLQARSAVPLLLPCNWAAMQWQLYDVVTLALPQVGASGTWLITSYVYAEGGGVDLTLVPHLASDYAWDPATHEQVVTPVVRPNFNSEPVAVTGLTVVGSALIETSGETTAYGLRATWDASTDVYLDSYQVQYKLSAEADTAWKDGGSAAGFLLYVGATTWEKIVSTDREYDVRVRIKREDGTVGPWATETNITVSGDTTAPGVPTGLSVSGTLAVEGMHTVAWTNPTSLDVMRARVYASTSSSPGSATEVAEVFGLPSTAYSATHTPASTPRYYWVTAVDRTGNESARTYAGMGT